MKCLLTLFISIYISCFQILAQQNNFEKRLYISGTDTLPFRLYKPDRALKRKRYPLVLFLHGSGATGRDNEAQLRNVPAVFKDTAYQLNFPCYILVPQCRPGDAWCAFPRFPESLASTEQPARSLSLVLEVLDSLLQCAAIDPSRLYVTGYSMGGEGTFDILTRRPGMFAAAIPVCGVADTGKAKLMFDTPMWIFHGDQDQVNDVKYSRMIVRVLAGAKQKPVYTEYPGVKHNSWINAYREPDLLPWMFRQKRKQLRKY